jgi:hypothetical protein
LYLAYRTDVGTGSVHLLVARRNRDSTIRYASFLIDLWKLGLKDSLGGLSAKRKKFDGLVNKMLEELERKEGLYYHPIEAEEAKWLVAQGVRIAEAVGTPSSRRWVSAVVGDLSRVRISGSLYKCYACEKGELSKDEDSLILRVAMDEGRRRVAGTPAESMGYFTCDACKSTSTEYSGRRNLRRAIS